MVHATGYERDSQRGEKPLDKKTAAELEKTQRYARALLRSGNPTDPRQDNSTLKKLDTKRAAVGKEADKLFKPFREARSAFEKAEAVLGKRAEGLEKPQKVVEDAQERADRAWNDFVRAQDRVETAQAKLEKAQAKLKKPQAALDKAQAKLSKIQAKYDKKVKAYNALNEKYQATWLRLWDG